MDAVESRSPQRSSWPEWVTPLGSGLALAAIGAGLLSASWGHGPDVLIDFGRELYMAWRLSEGEVLYRDLRHLSGPLSPYWNALVFRIFGVGLHSLVWANVALIALMTGLLYGLLRRIAGPLSAFMGPAVMLLGFAFGQLARVGNYNYVTPYAHEITHGLALSLGVLAVLAVRERLGAATYGLAGLLLGAVALTKVEVFLPIGAALALFSALELRAEAATHALRPSPALRRLGLVVLGAGLAPTVALLLLTRAMPLGDALQALADPWIFAADPAVRALPFYRRGMGTLAPWQSLATIAHWSAYWALFVGGTTWVALRVPVGRHLATGLALGVAFSALLFLGPQSAQAWLAVTTPLPLAIGAWGVFEGVRQWRRPTPAAGSDVRLRLAFALFAVLLAAKIGLRTTLAHYGFVLAMPCALLAVAALLDWIPRWVDARGGHGVLVRGATLGAIGALLLATHQITQSQHERHRQRVGSGADAFLADSRGFHVNALLEQLDALPDDATLLVLPEGVMINYLARRRNPTPYLNFMPPELLLFGEEPIRQAFQLDPPDYVALVHKSTREYGLPFFGVDYGRSLRAFVDGQYRLISRIGDVPLTPDASFGITLHQRLPDEAR